jgi:hypothetical protein
MGQQGQLVFQVSLEDALAIAQYGEDEWKIK